MLAISVCEIYATVLNFLNLNFVYVDVSPDYGLFTGW